MLLKLLMTTVQVYIVNELKLINSYDTWHGTDTCTDIM